jgi:4-alpha-glucanotransferase
MGKKILFAMALHNHQPVGNFDFVFEDSFHKCYKPFLNILKNYPMLKVSLHYSGPLLDWMEKNHRDFIDELRTLTQAGQVEIIGGAYYEPILPLLPHRDRIGQIKMQADYTRRTFGQDPKGLWLAERVWEQSLVSDMVEGGVKYTMVDDSHFKFAGARSEAITGYYLTEDQGSTMAVFPMDEKLRHYIPFQNPEDTIKYLGTLATEMGNRLMVYADDGEKFGSWPNTYKHIYEDGWLTKFLDLLKANADWIETITLGEAMVRLPAIGKIYIPDASYREMMGWALPPETHEELEDLEKELETCGVEKRARFFIKGATWRNFQARYEEAAEMYAKMLSVSKKVAAMTKKGKAHEEAITLLYQGECNCPYWHGVFGGLYLPHLRSAIYDRLIKAEAIADPADNKDVAVRTEDYNMDGHDEILVATGPARMAFKPDDGGHMFENDVIEKSFNVLATLTRRRESYHRAVLSGQAKTTGDIASIHDAVRLKDPEVRNKIVYDWYKKESLIDHFFASDTELKGLCKCRYRELGDFVNMPYRAESKAEGGFAVVRMERHGGIWLDDGRRPFLVQKTVSFAAGSTEFAVDYAITNENSKELALDFGVEFNFALLGGNSPERYYLNGKGRENLGNLSTLVDLAATGAFAAVDDWKGIEWWLEFSQEASLWAFPVETASMSEYGIELVYQCSSVIPHWRTKLAPGETWRTTITYAPRVK